MGRVVAITTCVDRTQILTFFKHGFQVDRQLPPESTVKAAARSSRIIGRMLEGIADQQQMLKSSSAWLSRLGQVFWEIVQVAVPRSWPNLLARHLISVLYGFEIFLLVFGTILNPAVARFGGISLVLTAGVHFTINQVTSVMRGRGTPLFKLAKTLLIIVAVVCLIYGGMSLVEDLPILWANFYFRLSSIFTPQAS